MARRNLLRLAFAAMTGVGLAIAVQAAHVGFAAFCETFPCSHNRAGGQVGPVRATYAEADADARAHRQRYGHEAQALQFPRPFVARIRAQK